MLNIKILLVIIGFLGLVACTSNDIKDFGKDIAHNVNCDQQYNHMHKGPTLRDECLTNRP